MEEKLSHEMVHMEKQNVIFIFSSILSLAYLI